jgi:SAM-dependent methyltransferase
MEVAGGRDPLSLFHITNCEYEAHTGTTASQLLLKAGRTNVAVRYGPELGDATRLAGLADQSFDVVWSSLFLGAFAVVDAGEGRKDAPMARAVIEQAWRVARHGAVVMHTDFSYLAGPPDSLDFPWAPQKQTELAVAAAKAAPAFKMPKTGQVRWMLGH